MTIRTNVQTIEDVRRTFQQLAKPTEATVEELRSLSFSNPPTQAECQALQAKVLALMDELKAKGLVT